MNNFFLSIVFSLSFFLSGYASYEQHSSSYEKEKKYEKEKVVNNLTSTWNKISYLFFNKINSCFGDDQSPSALRDKCCSLDNVFDKSRKKMEVWLARCLEIYDYIPPENILYGSGVAILATGILLYAYYSKKVSARRALIERIEYFIQESFFCLPEMKGFLKKNTLFFEKILEERVAQGNNTFGDGFSSDLIVKAFESVISYGDLIILKDYLTIKKLVEKYNSSFFVKKINFGEILISMCLQGYQTTS